MAIVQSIMKNRFITPLEMAKYAINNGYCQGYTTNSFFSEMVTQEKYRLNCIKLQKGDIQKVKNLLSDGKHMAIAIMGPSHFTKGGHYIVLSGVTTNNGYNYFDVLDPHKDNPNYNNDGTMIDNVKNDGRVLARTSIFAAECQGYWVYSTSNKTSNDPLERAMLNLENLGYSGMRNTGGQLINEWKESFDKVISVFLKDYGLTSDYNNLSANKEQMVFSWIQQAVNGQRSPVNVPKDPKIETITNNYYLSDLFKDKYYDALAAVAYMTNPKYNTADESLATSTDIYNKEEYMRFGDTDCANFVSQALVAGGVLMNRDFYFYKGKINIGIASPSDLIKFMWKDYAMNENWSVALSQYNYFSNKNNGYTKSDVININSDSGINDITKIISEIRVGDLLFWEEDGAVNHSTIITKIENGMAYYSGHAYNRLNYSLWDGYQKNGKMALHIIKMNR